MQTFQAKSGESEAQALSLQNVGGVFLVLFLGAILALFGSFLEMVAHVYKESRKKKESFVHQLKTELGFVVQFKRNIKEISFESEEEK